MKSANRISEGTQNIMIGSAGTRRIQGSAVNAIEQTFRKRCLLFTGWVVIASTLFAHSLVALIRVSVSTDDASYLILIPFISAYVVFVERRKIFQTLSYDAIVGCSLLLAAVCVAFGASLTTSASV